MFNKTEKAIVDLATAFTEDLTKNVEDLKAAAAPFIAEVMAGAMAQNFAAKAKTVNPLDIFSNFFRVDVEVEPTKSETSQGAPEVKEEPVEDILAGVSPVQKHIITTLKSTGVSDDQIALVANVSVEVVKAVKP